MFAEEVLPEFRAKVAVREARKAENLKPHIDAALSRKQWRPALRDDEIPVIEASVCQVQANQDSVPGQSNQDAVQYPPAEQG